MGNIPNLIDIESYCNELATISDINVNIIRFIVLRNFASVYSSQDIAFTDATNKIENEIIEIINKKHNNDSQNKSLKVAI
ncbi:MAG: hypothetical protein OSJ65_07295 [Bacilli bacterium]|nr:hypothetical protein [Bacilli bacterium]